MKTLESVDHACKRILLATDFSLASEAAFQEALRLSAIYHSELFLLHVYEYAATAVPPGCRGQVLGLKSVRHATGSSLRPWQQSARNSGVACEIWLEDGNAASTILDAISRQSIDLAVLGTNALLGFQRERWRVHYNTIRPHSSLGYRSPAPKAWLTSDTGHGEVESATRFPLLHTPDGGYLNSEIADRPWYSWTS